MWHQRLLENLRGRKFSKQGCVFNQCIDHGKGHQTLESTSQGSGGVTISESVQNVCRCGTRGQGLVVTVLVVLLDGCTRRSPRSFPISVILQPSLLVKICCFVSVDGNLYLQKTHRNGSLSMLPPEFPFCSHQCPPLQPSYPSMGTQGSEVGSRKNTRQEDCQSSNNHLLLNFHRYLIQKAITEWAQNQQIPYGKSALVLPFPLMQKSSSFLHTYMKTNIFYRAPTLLILLAR